MNSGLIECLLCSNCGETGASTADRIAIVHCSLFGKIRCRADIYDGLCSSFNLLFPPEEESDQPKDRTD